MRKACPPDLSPSNSVGSAGGGGHPAGTAGVNVDTFFRGFFSSSIIPSRCLNLIIKLSNCLLVVSSLACDSARASSKAARQSSTEPRNTCCVRFMTSERLKEDPEWRRTQNGYRTEWTSVQVAVQSVFRAVTESAFGGDLILM